MSKKLAPSLILSLLFAFSGRAAVTDRVVAVVGDEPILASDIRRFKELVSKSQALAGIWRVNPKGLTDEMILKRMIEEKIVAGSVKELEVPVAETEVDTQIATIAKNNNLTIQQLQDSLRREGVPFDIYRQNIRNQLERRNIFDRELRRGGGVAENELRAIYERRTKPEVRLALLSTRNAKQLGEAKAEILAKKMTYAATQEKWHVDELDWLSPDSLDESVAKLVDSAKPGDWVGPVKIQGKSQLVFLRERRKGSEEDFQKMKSELSQEAQMNDYERRFASWIERRKTEMQIVVNPQ